MPNRDGLLASRLKASQTKQPFTQDTKKPAKNPYPDYPDTESDDILEQFALPKSKILSVPNPPERDLTSDPAVGSYGSDKSIDTPQMQREADLEMEQMRLRREEEKKTNRWKMSTRIINILLVVGCLYVLFLIYGVMVTDYQYSENGSITAQKLSISDIAEQKSFESIYYQYLNCRALYEESLILDYRMGEGVEDPLVIAPEYEALLDEVTNLSVQTKAMDVDTRYAQIQNIILTWIKDDIAVYLQNMSSAISTNNAETANKALQDRNRVYSNFSIITQNIVAMGEGIKGIDLTDIKEWTPETYVDKKINGK